MAKTLPQVPILPPSPRSVHCAPRSCGTWPPRTRAAITVLTYGKAVEQLDAFLPRSGMPTAVDAMTASTSNPSCSTWSQRLEAVEPGQPLPLAAAVLQWLLAEGEIRESPMRNMKPPAIPEEPPEMLRDEQLKALLATVDGTDFESRRDAAILSLLVDSRHPPRRDRRPARQPTSTSTTRWWWCWARAGARGPRRSAARPRRCSTATCASARATDAGAECCGSASRAGSPPPASPRW